MFERFQAEQGAYERFQREQGKPTKAALTKRRMDRANLNDREALANEGPSYAERTLGGVASLARDIPGGEALQSYMRAITRGSAMAIPGPSGVPVMLPMPGEYTKARTEIRDAEATNPYGSGLNRLIGGTVAAIATPGGAMHAGARYGAAKGLLESDPNADAPERIHDATLGLLVGGAAGKTGELAGRKVASWMTRTVGKQALTMRASREAEDILNYGKAAAEGAAYRGQIPPELRAAVNAPDIKPYIETVLQSRKFANAPPEQVLMEAYKLMGQPQSGLVQRVVNADNFKAGTSLEAADIGLAKEQFKDAMGKVMPSFPKAVGRHAEMMGEREAMQRGADAARRIFEGTKVAGKKLEKNSVESFFKSIETMTPAQAQAAKAGMLGRAKEYGSATINPLKLFGAPKAAYRMQQLSKYLEALDTQAGTTMTRLAPSSVAAAGLLYQ